MEDQCLQCLHYYGDFEKHDQHCAAFPKGIPDKVWKTEFDHNNPFEGDHGVRFVPQSMGDD